VDNASGVVAVLEAARGLARYRRLLRRTIKFGFFGVEESGLVGLCLPAPGFPGRRGPDDQQR